MPEVFTGQIKATESSQVSYSPEYHKKWRQSESGKASKMARDRRYYATEKGQEERRRQRRRRIKRNYEVVRQAKNKPCSDCGNRYPICCMEFHHVKGKKLFHLSRLSNYSLAQVLREIEKCVLLCAICHRIRHLEGPDGDQGFYVVF